MDFYFSFIIPVYNRPDEVDELLESLSEQHFIKPFEVVIVEDGSAISSQEIVEKYKEKLQISYYYKENSGPGDSRNYGMRRAKGNYYLILDSDCILPPQYLNEVEHSLKLKYVDCFGGPDAAHDSFSTIQKSINYSMTSLFTTGGIRGNKKSVGKFQPRSFNMGLSKQAFETTGGFGKIHPGEDPDLTIRLWKAGFDTKLIEKAFVYHKRRISWKKFYQQVHKFGLTRPILNSWHPETSKITYWFPALFLTGFIFSVILYFFRLPYFLWLYALYFGVIFIDSFVKNKSIKIAFLSILAVVIQFYGYATGFVKSTFLVNFLNKKPQKAFPKLFFN
ncbi:glycosyltransferase [Abyssalbus ytuae]|uniref:Glycosyltransferase n=1 Tax=Abyssalbus ytuae TaxID=2926907 RepID=A0A9E6ZMZ9_9FLAO|nr:glycosyltransferase [Abyssalbus ytuae]UOB17674.1 glycosyltransferase [Abyssalbus ytuae]